MPLVENGKYVLSKIDGARHCKQNGKWKIYLQSIGMTEEEYLVQYELEVLPQCIICGRLPKLGSKWEWKKNCNDPVCVKKVSYPEQSAERRANVSAKMKAVFSDPVWAATQQAKMHAANQIVGEDGLTGYERSRQGREKTCLEKYGHAQYANWDKTKQTWAEKSDEEKDAYAKWSSEMQLAFPEEKKKAISDKIVAGHLEKYGVACPANLYPQHGSSKISARLFEALSIDDAEYKPKTKEHSVGRLLVDFRIGTKVIEFYGDYWHANPAKFKPDDVVGKGQWPAKTVWKKDADRIKAIEEQGYQVKIVWERDFKRHPDKVIQECKDWLNE